MLGCVVIVIACFQREDGVGTGGAWRSRLSRAVVEKDYDNTEREREALRAYRRLKAGAGARGGAAEHEREHASEDEVAVVESDRKLSAVADSSPRARPANKESQPAPKPTQAQQPSRQNKRPVPIDIEQLRIRQRDSYLGTLFDQMHE